MTFLYQIPRGSKILANISHGKEKKGKMRTITFHHLDGMYSYCTVDGEDEKTFGPVHLSVGTPLKKVDDHYEINDQP